MVDEVPAVLIRGGTVVTMDARRAVGRLDVVVGGDGRIAAVASPGSGGAARGAQRVIDATGRVVVPGLVQAHLHLCQTLNRGLAEDLHLLRWLRERTWPLEAAHDPDSLAAAARLGIAELLLGGTTSILDMGTVRHHDVVFEAARDAGIRYVGGKAKMDAGDGVPAGLFEETAVSLAESDRLARCWHGAEGGRLRYAYCPRFALSCTRELMRAVGERVRGTDLRAHTHAAEFPEEREVVSALFDGMTTITLLHELGIAGPEAALAHAVWPEPEEITLLAAAGASAVQCPSSNMKTGAGITPVQDYRAAGVNVALGADGAACNNRLDGWEELRLCGLMAKLRDGPQALPVHQVFEIATLGGARALGLEREVGSIEAGKRADLVIVDVSGAHAVGPADVYTQLVYSTRAADVRTVLVDGKVVVEEGSLKRLDGDAVIRDAVRQRALLVGRAFGSGGAPV